jgi:hypothetical protein
MPCQLTADCLYDIFEYLNDDKKSLYSCLLASRLCCEIAVRILWKDFCKFYKSDKPYISLSIIETLIACLSKESKELLYKNGIVIIPTQKPLLFNYASFCKVISIENIKCMVKHSRSITYRYINIHLVLQELLKMIMNQVSSLKALYVYSFSLDGRSVNFSHSDSLEERDIEFIYSPVTNICCLKYLTILRCDSNTNSEFFYQISQICHNIQSLIIVFESDISNGLADLISLQNNLKIAILAQFENCSYDKIIPSLIKHSLTLTKLTLKACEIPLSFIAMFKNLQELNLYRQHIDNFSFDHLQYVYFSQLKILKIANSFRVNVKMLINFLEISGRNLTEFHVSRYYSNSLNLALAEFCPNLKILYTCFKEDGSETLKLILNNCQYLETIRIHYDNALFNSSNTFFKVLAKYSQKNFYELIIDCYNGTSPCNMLHKKLEEFFINWQYYHTSQKSLSLIIFTGYSHDIYPEVLDNIKILVEKYKKLGIIKKFETDRYDSSDYLIC